MHETNHRFRQLLQGYLGQSLNKDELTEFFALLQQPGNEVLLQEALDKDLTGPVTDITSDTQKREALQALLQKTGRSKMARISPLWRRVAAAAAVLLFLVAGFWWLAGRRESVKPQMAQTPVVNDVLPGGDRAVLTLADGRHIVLDSVQGHIVQQGNLQVTNQNGKLDYTGKAGIAAYHTLSTPRGGQYKLLLPDGTRVWLNAASSITYPVAFTGSKRDVKVTGEVFFEVAKDKTKPFIVDVDGRSAVEVLGTHFNINAYSDEENIKTTLLEGKVKVSATQPETSNPKPETLFPGQQAIITNKIIIKDHINIEEVMAWKNGLFNFENASLQEVMRQLARWYAVDVKYESDLPGIEFQGKLGRDVSLSKILAFFREYGVESRIENGNQLIIRKK